jgi:hypothetical protein
MIKQILDVLPYLKGETEYIQIAKGKYQLPSTFKEAFKKIKKETKWRQ